MTGLTLAEVSAIGVLQGVVISLEYLIRTSPAHAPQFSALLIEAERRAAAIYGGGLVRRGRPRMDRTAYDAPMGAALNMIVRTCAPCPVDVAPGTCRLALAGAAASVEMHPPTSRPPGALEAAVTAWLAKLRRTVATLEAAPEADPAATIADALTLLTEGVPIGWRFLRVTYARRPPPAPPVG